MFQHAAGPLYDFMKSLGRDMSDCGHGSPLRRLLGQDLIGSEWIVAHMNELDEGDFELLEKNPVHVVHCPASHRYFDHCPFPMDRLRALRINISLGTDSLASTDSLSMFHEMRNVCDRYASIAPQDAIEMVTVNPARALRRSSDLGRVASRARADLMALPIAPSAKSVFEEIVWHRQPVDWLMVNGQVLPGLEKK
jgi:cytosine/adenosine deaminase-related metal-dependent hydrolase